MLKRLCYVFFFFSLTFNILEAEPNWNPPPFSESPDDLGHIFAGKRGHFENDSPKNRAFIQFAVDHPSNKVATNNFGAEIYLKTMPDGSQAWAEVNNGYITNGGRNHFPKEWVPDSNNFKGGYFTTPKFARYDPNDISFQGHLVVNEIISTYKTHSQTPQLSTLPSKGKIRGVTGQYGKIINLLDFPNQVGEHTLLLPTDELAFA